MDRLSRRQDKLFKHFNRQPRQQRRLFQKLGKLLTHQNRQCRKLDKPTKHLDCSSMNSHFLDWKTDHLDIKIVNLNGKTNCLYIQNDRKNMKISCVSLLRYFAHMCVQLTQHRKFVRMTTSGSAFSYFHKGYRRANMYLGSNEYKT